MGSSATWLDSVSSSPHPEVKPTSCPLAGQSPPWVISLAEIIRWSPESSVNNKDTPVTQNIPRNKGQSQPSSLLHKGLSDRFPFSKKADGSI